MADLIPKIKKGDIIKASWLNGLRDGAFNLPTSTQYPLSFRRDSTGDHYFTASVGATLSWGVVDSDYTSDVAGRVFVTPSNKDGQALESDTIITVFVTNPRATAYLAISDLVVPINENDIVAYFPFSDASGMLVNTADIGLPNGGATHKVLNWSAASTPIWDWVRAHA